MDRVREIYAELRDMDLPAQAWALLAELTNINLWDARFLRAEAEERKAKDRERKKATKENSMENSMESDPKRKEPKENNIYNTPEGGTGGTHSTEIPRKPIDALAPVIGADLGRAVIEHRSKLRAPLTLRAAEALANRLKTFPNPQVAAEKMLEKGWKSIERDWLKEPPNVVEFSGGPRPFKPEPPKLSNEQWKRMKGQQNDASG